MKPIRHRLQEGGLGEVVSEEMLEGVVQVQHDAIDLLSGDHQIDWRGMPGHDGLRWARSVAHIEIFPPQGDRPIDEVRTRLHFSQGFEEPPRVRGGRRSTLGGSARVGWFLDWKTDWHGPQAAKVGFILREPMLLSFVPVIVDAGMAAYGGTDMRRADDEGRGWAYLGPYDIVTIGEDTHTVISDEQRNLHFLTLVIR